MANEISDNTAGMNGESASVARLPAPIEFDREQNIRSFRLAGGYSPSGRSARCRFYRGHLKWPLQWAKHGNFSFCVGFQCVLCREALDYANQVHT